ncbi:MAG: hypothetical protein ACREID_02120, partial [Planctomycetota bacterium]
QGNRGAWGIGWAVWSLAAPSLVLFYDWWAARLPAAGWARAGVLVAAAGMCCDWAGEGLLALVLVEQADLSDFRSVQRTGTLLTAGAANGLYTIGGVLLTLRTTGCPRWVRLAIWMTWLAGAGMTVCALLDEGTGLVVSTAVLFPLLIVWVVWMALSWKAA